MVPDTLSRSVRRILWDPRIRKLVSIVAPARIHPLLRKLATASTPKSIAHDFETYKRLLSKRDESQPISGRVILVCGSLQPGGAERQVVYTMRGLSRSGLRDLHLLCDYLHGGGGNNYDFYLPQAVAAGGETRLIRANLFKKYSIYALPEGFSRVFNSIEPGLAVDIANLYWEFKDLRPEVVHCWLDWSNVRAGLAAALAGVPRIILSGRNLSPRHFSLYQPYMDSAYKALIGLNNICLINNSYAGASDYAAWLGIDANAVTVVYNGFELDADAHPRPGDVARLRSELNIPAGAPVVGSVFRFSREKRPLLWIEVARKVADFREDVHFIVFGEGILRKDMEFMAKTLGISDRVHMPGITSDVYTGLAAMDVLLLTSMGEGNPNVVLEAQALGVPVVTATGGGAAETIDHGQTGWVVQGEAAEDFAERVQATLADNEFRTLAACKGPKLVSSRFGMARMTEETLHVYGYSRGAPARE